MEFKDWFLYPESRGITIPPEVLEQITKIAPEIKETIRILRTPEGKGYQKTIGTMQFTHPKTGHPTSVHVLALYPTNTRSIHPADFAKLGGENFIRFYADNHLWQRATIPLIKDVLAHELVHVIQDGMPNRDLRQGHEEYSASNPSTYMDNPAEAEAIASHMAFGVQRWVDGLGPRPTREQLLSTKNSLLNILSYMQSPLSTRLPRAFSDYKGTIDYYRQAPDPIKKRVFSTIYHAVQRGLGELDRKMKI